MRFTTPLQRAETTDIIEKDMRTKKVKELPKDLPLYCDFSCRYASFGTRDVSGACRREQAVYCTILKKYNNKNNKCLVPKD